jgi:hypothetical protein
LAIVCFHLCPTPATGLKFFQINQTLNFSLSNPVNSFILLFGDHCRQNANNVKDAAAISLYRVLEFL